MANRSSSDLPPKGGSYRVAPKRALPRENSVASAFKRKVIALVTIPLLGVSLVAQTGDRSQAETQARRAAERLGALHRESQALAKQERTLLAELRKLEIAREIKVEELAKIRRDTADVQGKLGDATRRSAELAGRAEQQRPDVEARMVQLYKMGRAGYWRMLLDATSLRDLGRAYRTAAALGRIDRDRVEEHRKTLAALAAERANLQTRAKELTALERKALEARVAADRAVQARTDLVASIDARRDLNAQLTGELQDAQLKLQATLTSGSTAGAPRAIALPLRPFQGALPWPSEGVLSARFGRQPEHSPGPPVRNGVEISLPERQAVRAVHEGTVAYADPFTGYAYLVIVEHSDKTYSLYGHLSEMSVKKGDRVDAGANVGLAGRNPAGNPALYFELRVDGKPVDPLQWLKR